MAKRIDAILSLKDDFSKTLERASTSLKTFEKQAGEIGTSLYHTSNSLDSLGNKFMPLTVGAVGAVTGSVAAFGEYETALKGVQKTTDLSGDALEAMSDEIIAMTREIPASATEIAGVAEAAGQLGISQEGLLDFTETMVMMGTATNMSSEEAATTLARFANITGMAEGDFDRLGSTIVALGNNMATTESEIADMGLRLAATSSQVGLTEDETLALAGTLSSLGVQAEAGGTAMSTVMTKINSAVGEGGESLDKFASVAGMSAEEFASVWQDAPADALVSIVEGLGEAGESGENLDVVLEELGITGIRETDTMKRLAGSGDMLAESFGLAGSAWEENSALATEASIAYESFENQVQFLKNALFEVGEVLATKVLPAITPVIEKITELAYAFVEADEETQNFYLKIAAGAIAIGPALKLAGALAGGIGRVFDQISRVGKALSGGETLLGAIATPGFKFVAILGLIAGAAVLIYKNWDRIGPVVEGVAEKFKDFGQAVGETLSPLVDRFKELAGQIKDALSGAFNWLLDELLPSLGGLAESILGVFEHIGPPLADIIGILVYLFIDVLGAAIEVLKFAFGSLGDGVTAVLDIMSGFIDFVVNIFTGNFSAAGDSLIAIGESVRDFLISMWERVADVLGIDPEPVVTLIKDTFEKGVEKVKDLWGKLKEFLSAPIQGVVNIAQRGGEALRNIGRNAEGTDYWRGGPTWVGEEGPEIIDLPRGSRVFSNPDSMAMVQSTRSQGGRPINITIPKMADQIVVREEADIDKFADRTAKKIASKLRNTSPDMA